MVYAQSNGTDKVYEKLLEKIREKQSGKVYKELSGKINERLITKDKNFTVNGVSFTMIYVQGGTFIMGDTSELRKWYPTYYSYYSNKDEKPTHSVTLSSYYIGETEVTQALWQAVMGSNPSKFRDNRRPVENVSWEDCQTFISILNSLTGKQFHLPTEAQWEYAARGGNKSNGYTYSGSDYIDTVAWYLENGYKNTQPVKTKSPNELGLYDMSGNVCEWCQDWYGSYSSDAQTNPTGASNGPYGLLVRGGSFLSQWWYCRSTSRYYFTPSTRNSEFGLRLAL